MLSYKILNIYHAFVDSEESCCVSYRVSCFASSIDFYFEKIDMQKKFRCPPDNFGPEFGRWHHWW